ncbi:hypothetical protein AAG570_002961 [Ranatra chinensis]|uniref:IP5PC-F beta-propeller domain-containing protein n=1 Tax=Ranatra chinensis TaxID=642074 RepID=A0ABD0Y6J0_9HEMI
MRLQNGRDDEEIDSEDEPFESDGGAVDDEEIPTTAQEKKLELAKKYLAQLEEQEKEKEEPDGVMGRLRADVLEQAGKLRKKVAGKIKTKIGPEDVVTLRCKEHKQPITCLVVSSSSERIYSGCKGGYVVMWCLKTAKKIMSIAPEYKKKDAKHHSGAISALALSQDGRCLASSDSGCIRLWDAHSLTHMHTFAGHTAPITSLAFCRRTPTLYSASKDRTVKLWNVLEMGYIETLFGHQASPTCVEYFAKDRVLTSGGSDRSVRLWKIPEESHLVFNGHSGNIECVRRLDDGHFVTCGDDGELCLWGALKKKPLATVKLAHGLMTNGEPYWLNCVATIDNAEVFASGSSDGYIRLWQAEDNYRKFSQLLEIPLLGFMNAMTFTEDGSRLIVGLGKEHRLGRWTTIKEAKNSIVVINLMDTES